MNTAIKIFLSYAAISMTCGFFLMMLEMSGVIPYRSSSPGVVLVLWLGPAMLGVSIGLPIGLWKLWST